MSFELPDRPRDEDLWRPEPYSQDSDSQSGEWVPAVSPGSKCPTCERRVPHPKKSTSPQTKVVSIRVPVGDADSFKEMLGAAAGHLGLAEKPHSTYWTVLHGLVLALQGPRGGEEG